MLGACDNARNSNAGCMFELHVIDTLLYGLFYNGLLFMTLLVRMLCLEGYLAEEKQLRSSVVLKTWHDCNGNQPLVTNLCVSRWCLSVSLVGVICKQYLLEIVCSLCCVCFISLWCMWCLPDASAVLEDWLRAV